MFDTHCHLNFKRFKKNLDEVISRAFDAGVTKIVIPGTDITSSKKAIEIAEKYDGIYAAVGIHPHHTAKYSSSVIPDSDPESRKDWILNQVQDDIFQIKQLLNHPKVVAVGEVGMDRHKYEDTKYEAYNIDNRFLNIQKKLLRLQIELAIKHNKSLILHNREAREDILQIIEENWDNSLSGRTVFHCCEPNLELLNFAKEHNMFIGVDGDVTYDKAKQEFIKQVPFEMLVLETDSPFILPEPLLSQKKYPNEPKNIRYVIEAVAKLKGEKVDKVEQVTTKNGTALFHMALIS
ncbi:MAG: hypothetical protein US54_C0075G0005 [Candidatus Roizmanbacteria bacterium GW2011_GWA2_37_7]|uniref:Hydrolase, TatD family n=1 Tax=Candidatus Roizmanbacteria bacterium GW2011_GWA2_37_7 TaxID=1618481 RepID=A0A0G0K6J5_9BACT|nr:MAG: hypothetical protein US54_C0075G0005 [Candidatus Roizmanbacteria bacterium GW2011_GWA2_37_7]